MKIELLQIGIATFNAHTFIHIFADNMLAQPPPAPPSNDIRIDPQTASLVIYWHHGSFMSNNPSFGYDSASKWCSYHP